jgi:hypothetical protein
MFSAYPHFEQRGKCYNHTYIIKPPQSAGLLGTTILKVGSNGEIVREIKRIQQLNS